MDDRIAYLQRRWKELHQQLQQLLEGKVVEGDPAVAEDAIHGELDEIEFELGEEWARQRRKVMQS